jgi:hypothetical protein
MAEGPGELMKPPAPLSYFKAKVDESIKRHGILKDGWETLAEACDTIEFLEARVQTRQEPEGPLVETELLAGLMFQKCQDLANHMGTLTSQNRRLWKIARAAAEHCRTHGHTTDNSLDDALIEAGLLDPKLATWRKGKR